MTQQDTFFRFLYAVVILLVWEFSAQLFHSPDFPALTHILQSVLHFYHSGELIHNIAITLQRVLISFILAMVLGTLLGMVMAIRHRLNILSDMLLVIALNVPALVTIILAYIWFGLIESAALLAVVFNKLPTVIVSVREGARVIDPKLNDFAKVYRLSTWRYYRYIYLPQLYPYILLAARNGLSLIWKIVLVVELLGRSDGVGFALHSLFQFFDIAGILAYTLCFILVVYVIELLLFKPFEQYIQRGRTS
ncbi:MAG: ABC transporter permease subunit [Glaciecola sp.]|jgi:NitT/TauT family transport system permease protein